MKFDLDLSQHFVDAPAIYEFAGCSSTSYLKIEFDAIVETEPVVIVASSSCPAVPAIHKAMNGCELRTGDVGALLHEEFPLSCPFPLSTFLRSEFCSEFLRI